MLQIFGWAGSNMTETNGLGFLSTGLSLWAVGRQRDDEHHDDYGWCGFFLGLKGCFLSIPLGTRGRPVYNNPFL